MKSQPYYIVPLLIEQPTWGGSYIAAFKAISQNEVITKNIGQSYELASESLLTDKPEQVFDMAEATDISHPVSFGERNQVFSLQELIAANPEAVLGKKVVAQHGETMPLLIKFTQAQNNSYQLHVKPGEEFDGWVPKPESWYYFETGKATLGINPEIDIAEYKQVCEAIYQESLNLSEKVASKQLTIDEARNQLEAFINKNHPRQFVNTITVAKGSVIDLSAGGIHHSWEKGVEAKNGNIVYEVQRDVKDDVSTLRSFDQGKIKDSGDVRTLTIDEYFQALDSDPEKNNPDSYLRDTHTKEEAGAQISQLFDNDFYSLTSISFSGTYTGSETKTQDQFHHLFVQTGSVKVETESGSYPLEKGWSLFIPANTSTYSLVSEKPATVLKTTV